MSKNIVIAITGASGAAYSRRLIDCLCAADHFVHLVMSPNGRRLLNDELGISDAGAKGLLGRDDNRLIIYPYKDIGSRLASGSFHTDGMIVCPCSSNTLGAIASGLGDNLVNRAAAVTLKENRRLVLLHREMPLSYIELQNMLRLQQAGAIICPASPGFYMLPTTIDDLVDFVVGKLLDLFQIQHGLNTRWTGAPAPEGTNSA